MSGTIFLGDVKRDEESGESNGTTKRDIVMIQWA